MDGIAVLNYYVKLNFNAFKPYNENLLTYLPYIRSGKDDPNIINTKSSKRLIIMCFPKMTDYGPGIASAE